MNNTRSSGHVPRIGILSPATEAGMRHWWKELTRGLNELGYVEGSNIELIWRFADGRFDRLPELASELAKLEVDIILPATPPAIHAAKSVSNNIPIVFPLGSDPVETGLVANLDRPGGYITGMATMSRRNCRARLGFAREIIPVVAAAANGREDARRSREIDGLDYVLAVRAISDQCGAALNHSIPHGASRFVTLVAGTNQLTRQGGGTPPLRRRPPSLLRVRCSNRLLPCLAPWVLGRLDSVLPQSKIEFVS
jgi:ABC transporter substrate binding protein